MSSADFCTCTDIKCPNHPVNHDKGCNLCIIKNLKQKEIPSCFFHKVADKLSPDTDYSFSGFANLVIGEK